jgi:hypothetical protein
MRMGRTLLAALTLAATLVLGACGSSPKPLTRAELTTKADAICIRVTRKLNSTSIKTPQDIVRIAPELAGFEQSALADLGKLVPPASLANDWKVFVAGAQTLAEDTAKLGEYAKSHNLKAAGGLIRASTVVQKRMMTIARRDGLVACEQTA